MHRRIDVHHHFLPPDLLAVLETVAPDWPGGPPVPRWSRSLAREAMDRAGIDVAIASVVPGVDWPGLPEPARWARRVNEFVAANVRADAARFGGFATLPQSDVGAACSELECALDALHLDGVILWTSVGGRYLGDPAFDELFAELDRRSAVALIHPNTQPPGSDVPKLRLPNALVEFVFDTTRCVTNLVYSGTLERRPSIRFIVAHAGGAVPFLAGRIALGASDPRLALSAPRDRLRQRARAVPPPRSRLIAAIRPAPGPRDGDRAGDVERVPRIPRFPRAGIEVKQCSALVSS